MVKDNQKYLHTSSSAVEDVSSASLLQLSSDDEEDEEEVLMMSKFDMSASLDICKIKCRWMQEWNLWSHIWTAGLLATSIYQFLLADRVFKTYKTMRSMVNFRRKFFTHIVNNNSTHTKIHLLAFSYNWKVMSWHHWGPYLRYIFRSKISIAKSTVIKVSQPCVISYWLPAMICISQPITRRIPDKR